MRRLLQPPPPAFDVFGTYTQLACSLIAARSHHFCSHYNRSSYSLTLSHAMSSSGCPSVVDSLSLTIASSGSRGPRLHVPVFAAAAYSTAGRGLLKRGLKAWGLSAGSNWGVSAAVLAAGAVNVAVLSYIAQKLYRSCVVQLETYQQLKSSHDRCWQLATQGAEAAGVVPADLGESDEHGVYTHHGATGTMYFRQCQHCGSSGISSWEFSTDRVFWIPACHADSLWYSPDGSPSTADKLLIQRLEVEAQLVARQGRGSSASCGGAAELPPLELSAAAAGDGAQIRQVPPAFLCPISMQVMTQPVVTPSGGSFNRSALMEWIRQHHTDPISGAPLRSDQVFPNLAMRDLIHEWANNGCDTARGRPQGRGRQAADSASSSKCSSPFKAGREALHTA